MLEIVYISVIVSVLWFLYIYQKDVFEPEPLGKILKAVAWGAVPAVFLSYRGCPTIIYESMEYI